MPKLKFLASTIPDIWSRSQNLKVGDVTHLRHANIWIPRPPFAYLLYNFYAATTRNNGSLQVSIPIVKAFKAHFWTNIWFGHVTCEYGVAGTRFLNSRTPIRLFTIQLS